MQEQTTKIIQEVQKLFQSQGEINVEVVSQAKKKKKKSKHHLTESCEF